MSTQNYVKELVNFLRTGEMYPIIEKVTSESDLTPLIEHFSQMEGTQKMIFITAQMYTVGMKVAKLDKETQEDKVKVMNKIDPLLGKFFKMSLDMGNTMLGNISDEDLMSQLTQSE